MMTADDYINQVLTRLPPTLPSRAQIALELRGHIAERLSGGRSIDDVLRQLGDPETLAQSYLQAEPLVNAPAGRRILAKMIDVLAVTGVMATIGLLVAWLIVDRARVPFVSTLPIVLAIALLGGSLLFGLYTIVSEWRLGQTIGKRTMDLRVVTEAGTRISVGQSIVRQLPMFLQIYAIDALFALATDRAQRAFELLSKTRVVKA